MEDRSRMVLNLKAVLESYSSADVGRDVAEARVLELAMISSSTAKPS